MEDDLEFQYEREYWFISMIVNSQHVDCNKKAIEIKDLILEKIKNITDEDLNNLRWNKEFIQKVKDMGKNISIQCKWNLIMDSFPYMDENTGLNYDTLGYLEFQVEYYANNSEEKRKINPNLIQQIPIIALNRIKEYSLKKENQYTLFDVNSPIFVFVVSSKTYPREIEWNKENINKYKHILGNWTEIYSGQWPDYSEELYLDRIKNNLSNRLSELHFIRRNSGFIYMAEENFKNFFESYIKHYVLKPTAQIRAINYALISFNTSLDILFIMREFMDLEVLEEKIKKLTLLQGIIQTRFTVIYNELSYNIRQHYTKVLKHLLNEFQLDELMERINNKFEVIKNSIDMIYNKILEKSQEKLRKGMNILNLLFGMGVLIDIIGAIDVTVQSFLTNNYFGLILYGIVSFALISVLMIIGIYTVKAKIEVATTKARRAVDAVVLDSKKESILLIRRKFPPFAGMFALPGGFIKPGESEKQALIREVKEETGIDIDIIKKIGIYDKPKRDPRGKVISNAFLCITYVDVSELKTSEETTEVTFIPINKIGQQKLAFDHAEIIKDALNLLEK